MKRFGQVIQLKPEGIEEYVRLHQKVWPGVLEMISSCNLRNNSIFVKDNLLFAYFEYSGADFDKDLAKMAGHAETQRWWAVVKPLMKPIKSASADEFWANMKEIFHLD